MKKNGEKPKILITESVIFCNHSDVFSDGESPNLKPKSKIIDDQLRWDEKMKNCNISTKVC